MIIGTQKKILILGGTKHMIGVVKEVRKMGMSPIVVEDIVGAPAKEYADRSFDINAANTEKLTKMAQEEKVDGIFTAFEYINTWNAIALSKKANLPFYVSKKNFFDILYREKFESICKRFDVMVIEQYEDGVEFDETSPVAWEFPIFVNSLQNNEELDRPLSR